MNNRLILNISRTVVSLAVVAAIVLFTPNSVKAADASSNAGLITVDLVIFAGQSNMAGTGGDAKLAPGVAHGCGYEFRNGQDPMGLYEVKEPFGAKESGYLVDKYGGGTMVSSFMNTYYDKTGIPVMGIYAAKGGSSIETFWLRPEVSSEFLRKYKDAVAWCNSNNVKIRHKYCVWLQGESDFALDPVIYKNDISLLFTPLFNEGLEQVFVVTPGHWRDTPGAMDAIVNTQIELCNENPFFTLASTKLHELPNEYMVDGVHYSQPALNMAGADAANTVAIYSKLGNTGNSILVK